MKATVILTKKLLVFVCMFCLLKDCSAQAKLRKQLIFFQDSLYTTGCGGILEVSVLYFVSDTSVKRRKSSEYFILAKCPELYGENFFKKGSTYLLDLDKDYSEVKKYMPLSTFETFHKTKRLYVLKRVKKTNQ